MMTVSENDMSELRRIYTNTYSADKAFVNRVIQGIRALNNEIGKLKTENKKLRDELDGR